MLKTATLAICLLLTLSACESMQTTNDHGDNSQPGQNKERESVLPVPAAQNIEGGSAVLLVAGFSGLSADDADIHCRWRITNRDSGKSYFLNLEPNKPYVFAAVDPGTYKTAKLGCGITRVWEVTDVFKDGFKVDAGHVSYLGKIVFKFKDGALDIINLATRVESAQGYLAASAATPAAQMPTISAFTEKPMDKAMVTGGDATEGFDVYAKGVDDPTHALNPLVLHLQTCSKTEATTDPLRFGKLEYVAEYKDGRFSEMKQRQEANAFSDHLRSCVERGIMAYHPPQKKDVEVRVRY